MFMLLVLFIGVPWLEFVLLMRVGGMLGLLPTLGVVVLTGVVGASLARAQGVALLSRLQAETAAGRVPADALLEGAAIFVAGLLLITPGFFTDACGLLLLVPTMRRVLVAQLRKRMEDAARRGTLRMHVGGFRRGGGPFGGAGGFGGPGGAPFGGGLPRSPDEGGVRDAEVIDVSGPDDDDDARER